MIVPVYTPPQEQLDPMTGSMVEEALKTEQQAQQQQQQENLIDMARKAAGLNYMQRTLASGLLGAKQDWQKAYEAGDANAMANAAMRADSLRKQGNAIGWDGEGYGSNVSLLEAAQNLANNDTNALSQLFYGMQRPGDYYDQEYDKYRDRGLSMNDAQRNAQRRAGSYQQENLDKLVDAYHMYGTDPRGAINQNGLRILGMMAQQGGISPSELVNFYAKMQATPKDVWNFDNSLIAAENANNYALGRMDRSQQYNRENQERSQNFQKEFAILQNDLTLQRMIKQAEIGISKGVMTREAAYESTVKYMMAAGYDEQTARQTAAYAMLGGGKGGTNGTTGGVKPDSGMFKALMEHANNLIARADEAAASGNKELAAQLMAEAEQYKQQANRYAAMGGDDGGNGGNVDVSPFGDYNEFMDWIQTRLKENKQKGYIADRESMYQLAKARGGQWADDVDWDGWYGTGGNSEPASKTEQPKKSSNYTAGTASGSGSQTGGKNTGRGLDYYANRYAMYELYDRDGKRIGAITPADAENMNVSAVYGSDGKLKRFEKRD